MEPEAPRLLKPDSDPGTPAEQTARQQRRDRRAWEREKGRVVTLGTLPSLLHRLLQSSLDRLRDALGRTHFRQEALLALLEARGVVTREDVETQASHLHAEALKEARAEQTQGMGPEETPGA